MGKKATTADRFVSEPSDMKVVQTKESKLVKKYPVIGGRVKYAGSN